MPTFLTLAEAHALGLVESEIERMVRAVKRFHFATLQDRHPIVRFLHNSYAVAIMDVLRDLATDDEIKAKTGTDIRVLRKEILAEQDRLHRIGEELAAKLGLSARAVFV